MLYKIERSFDMNNSMQDFVTLEKQEMEYRVALQTTQNTINEKIKALSEKQLPQDLQEILTKIQEGTLTPDEIKETIAKLTQTKEVYVNQMRNIYSEIKELQEKIQ